MPFQLPNQTSFAQFKPIYSGSTWVRPADWITITDAPNEVQFLVSDVVYPTYRIQTTFTRPGAENIYIDWGDGTTDTISTIGSTNTTHTYTSGGTASTLGYNMWKVRIYGDAGTTITNAALVSNTTYWGTNTGDSGLLEAYYGNSTNITTFTNLFYSAISVVRFNFLEYVKLPSTYNNAGALFQTTFRDCRGLQKVIMPTSMPNITNTSDMFNGCISLQEITLPTNMNGLLSMSSMFNACQLLSSVVFPTSLPALQGMSSLFQNCYSLGRVDLPLTPSAYQFDSMFIGCSSLLNVEIKSWSSAVLSGGTTFTMSSMFNSCSTLEDVKLPPSIAAGSTTTFDSVFTNCFALKTFTFFQNFNAISLNACFQFCYSLSKVVMPTSIPLLNNMVACFQGCSQLAEITLPNSVSASITLQNTFNSAYGLSEITIPSGYTTNSLSGTFSGARGLKRITLPPVAPTSMSNMCLACVSLESIVMPTNMASLQLFGSAFNGCQSLQSITLPANMSNTTGMNGAFNNCFNLKSVVMPTIINGSNFAQAFQNCFSLKSIILPATNTGTLTTYFQTFSGCFALESITFPTTQLLSINNLSNLGLNAYNLTGMTNTDKLGNPSTGSTTYIDGSSFLQYANRLPSLDLYCKFSKFSCIGLPTSLAGLTSLRLRNNGAGQYGGSSPQIDISYNRLGQAALVQVFNDLPTIVSKTINITGCSGAAALTAPERAIATGKGWTITG